jgi:hypothetical protein
MHIASSFRVALYHVVCLVSCNKCSCNLYFYWSYHLSTDTGTVVHAFFFPLTETNTTIIQIHMNISIATHLSASQMCR